MRIEKCVEDNGKTVTLYVEDDTVRATDHEAVRDLIQVLNDATSRRIEPVDLPGKESPGGLPSGVRLTTRDGRLIGEGLTYWMDVDNVKPIMLTITQVEIKDKGMLRIVGRSESGAYYGMTLPSVDREFVADQLVSEKP